MVDELAGHLLREIIAVPGVLHRGFDVERAAWPADVVEIFPLADLGLEIDIALVG